MSDKTIKPLLLAGLFFVSLLLRGYYVGKLPPALSWDEVSIGYNAYSILITGHDEHGRKLPLDTFAAYGDYKPPVSIYATVPFVAVFGLNELSVRLPSVLFGTLTVLLLYFLVLELFYGYKEAQSLAISSSSLMAISPWHLQLSRGGFEANIGLFFIVLGTYVFLISRRKTIFLSFASIPFVISVYTFNSSRYFVPLIIIALICYGWSSIRSNLYKLGINIVIATFLLLPIIPHLISPEARLRFHEVNIFTDPSIVLTANKRIESDGNAWWAKILHNRRIGYARSYLMHFFDHFEPKYLFIRGDGNPKFSSQETGQFYVTEAIFFVVGILYLFQHNGRQAWFLLIWIIGSIIPAATARETPHALRTLNGLPSWNIFIAQGILTLGSRFSSKFTRIPYKIILMGTYFLSFLYLAHNYYFHYSKEFSGAWQFGYKEAIQFIHPLAAQYKEIVVGDNLGRPYMYVLFYTKEDPALYVRNKESYFDTIGFYHVKGFGKYRFPQGNLAIFQKQTLYALTPSNVPAQAHVLARIHQLDGTEVFTIFDIL